MQAFTDYFLHDKNHNTNYLTNLHRHKYHLDDMDPASYKITWYRAKSWRDRELCI